MCGLKLNFLRHDIVETEVTPFVGVWIETPPYCARGSTDVVTPFVGVWIETEYQPATYEEDTSHPSWVCGLKLVFNSFFLTALRVTPFVGVWIETRNHTAFAPATSVTPFVGVWIETVFLYPCRHCEWSHPSWVCGLKLLLFPLNYKPLFVTPFVGVWIET